MSVKVEADEYAKELSRYIHLNPVRAGIVGKPEEYEWSSYRYYTVKRKAPEWLERNFILGYFDKRQAQAMKRYHDFVSVLIDQEYKNPLADIANPVILGSKEFVAEIKERFMGAQKPDRDLSALRKLSSKASIDLIEAAVDCAMPSDEKLARQVKLYFCHQYSGLKLREIGSRFCMELSGVTQASKRVSLKAEKDKNFGKILKRIEGNIIL